MVNVIAPIFTEKGGKAIKQTIFYPFAMAANNCSGEALRIFGKTPLLKTKAYGEVSAIPCAATWNEERREINIICANISGKQQEVEFDLRSFGKASWRKYSVLCGDDLSATNTIATPDRVKAERRPCRGGHLDTASVVLDPKSFHLLSFVVERT
jgi:alpha-N-arabinofuranosidase